MRVVEYDSEHLRIPLIHLWIGKPSARVVDYDSERLRGPFLQPCHVSVALCSTGSDHSSLLVVAASAAS